MKGENVMEWKKKLKAPTLVLCILTVLIFALMLILSVIRQTTYLGEYDPIYINLTSNDYLSLLACFVTGLCLPALFWFFLSPSYKGITIVAVMLEMAVVLELLKLPFSIVFTIANQSLFSYVLFGAMVAATVMAFCIRRKVPKDGGGNPFPKVLMGIYALLLAGAFSLMFVRYCWQYHWSFGIDYRNFFGFFYDVRMILPAVLTALAFNLALLHCLGVIQYRPDACGAISLLAACCTVAAIRLVRQDDLSDRIVLLYPIYIMIAVQTIAGIHLLLGKRKVRWGKYFDLSPFAAGECIEKDGRQKDFLNFLLTVAGFFVIVHCTVSGIFLGTSPDLKRWYISLAYYFVAKIAEPLFFMVAGYLFLNQVENWRRVLGRIGRLLVALLACAVVYGVYKTVFVNKAGFGALAVSILSVFKAAPSPALWFLYVFLGIFIMLPYLQKMARLMKKKDYHIFFVISVIVVGILPIAQHYSGHFALNPHLYLPLFGGYLLLFFLGQYFARFGVKKTKLGAYLALAVFVLMLGFNITATYFEYQKASTSYLFFNNQTLLPIVAEAVCVFYLATFLNFGPKMSRLLSWSGSCAFGIVLMSELIIAVLTPYYLKLYSMIHPLLAVVVLELCVFAAGFAVTAVLKKIPLIKNYL
ncbi:MAG: hypothetical protein E7464_04860 [Ruminococcaceae bacterium]|nr:hypothetical protein [Oscillospiraceae bacterium]